MRRRRPTPPHRSGPRSPEPGGAPRRHRPPGPGSPAPRGRGPTAPGRRRRCTGSRRAAPSPCAPPASAASSAARLGERLADRRHAVPAQASTRSTTRRGRAVRRGARAPSACRRRRARRVARRPHQAGGGGDRGRGEPGPVHRARPVDDQAQRHVRPAPVTGPELVERRRTSLGAGGGDRRPSTRRGRGRRRGRPARAAAGRCRGRAGSPGRARSRISRGARRGPAARSCSSVACDIVDQQGEGVVGVVGQRVVERPRGRARRPRARARRTSGCRRQLERARSCGCAARRWRDFGFVAGGEPPAPGGGLSVPPATPPVVGRSGRGRLGAEDRRRTAR